MSNIYYVYIHTFPNGTKYVGKGSGSRAYTTQGRNTHWKRLYTKYGKPRVHIIKDHLAEDYAFSLEKTIIDILRCTNILLCNITDGGEGQSGMTGDKAYWFGKPRSDSVKLKISMAVSGVNHPQYGTSPSVETRAKIGAKHRGKLVNPQTREILSQIGKDRNLGGERNPAYCNTLHRFNHPIHGEVTATQYELYTRFNLTRSGVCCLVSGKRPSHKGWRLS